MPRSKGSGPVTKTNPRKRKGNPVKGGAIFNKKRKPPANIRNWKTS